VTAQAPSDSGLAATGLACRRGGRLLFTGVELALAPGTLLWLRGPNGVGKTSLLRLLAGLAWPEAGAITWRGLPVRSDRAAWHRDSIYVGHANALKDDLTLAEAVTFLAALGGRDAGDGKVQRSLDAVGLLRWQDSPVRTLSQGQRRRGSLARLALDDEPRAWLLDEPHDALDVESAARLDSLLVAHARRGGSVLLTSHQELRLPGLASFDLGAFAARGAAR
jgi:heme exporter protein A